MPKQLHFSDLLFYFATATAILIAIFFDRFYLIFVLPVVISSIAILYIKKIDRINPWYLFSLFLMTVCDILVYTNCIKYFDIICLLTSAYFFLCSYVLKEYIPAIRFKLKMLATFPILVTTALIVYLIISISSFILDLVLPSLPVVITTVLSLIIYVVISYLIYVSDIYKKGINLLFVACICIFILALISINELVYYNTIFTVLINAVHILGFYIFMNFITETKPEDIKDDKDIFI